MHNMYLGSMLIMQYASKTGLITCNEEQIIIIHKFFIASDIGYVL